MTLIILDSDQPTHAVGLPSDVARDMAEALRLFEKLCKLKDRAFPDELDQVRWVVQELDRSRQTTSDLNTNGGGCHTASYGGDDDDVRLLTFRAAAERLGVSAATVSRAVKAGKLAAVPFGSGSRLRIPQAACDLYAASRDREVGR